MRPINLVDRPHPNFTFLRPTGQRINKSVAWLVACKHCGREQLVGSSQVVRGSHARCIYCQAPKELDSRRP